MSEETQISAVVSRSTKELLDRYVRATGVKKGYLIEQALAHHLRALQELPADVIIRPRLVVSVESGRRLAESIRRAKPTQDLRDLMRDGD